MKKLKIAYFGTPYFSARFLEKLLTDTSIKRLIEVKLVVAQPDQPIGRKHVLTKSPVKIVAEKFGIPVLHSPPAGGSLGQYFDKTQYKYYSSSNVEKKIDMGFLFAYGEILSKKILNLPKYGFWNTHPSLLPKYRGALPIGMPLILGDKETGVTLIKLDEKVDHGPIIAQEKLAIDPNNKRPDLEIKLTDLAFSLFKKTVLPFRYRPIPEWYIKTKEQNHLEATFTYQINKDAGFIPFSTLKKTLNNEPLEVEEMPSIIREYFKKNKLPIRQRPSNIGNSSQIIFNLYRGLFPWPGLWTVINVNGKEKRLKITDMKLLTSKLIISKVQLEGKKEVDFKTFNSAYSVF